MHKNTKRKGVTSMELKVFKDTLAAYGGRWETRQELPVETEILIPDYQPAVFKIVKCLMQPVVLQNRVASGRWHCEGYLPLHRVLSKRRARLPPVPHRAEICL